MKRYSVRKSVLMGFVALGATAHAAVLVDTFSQRGLPEQKIQSSDTSSFVARQQQIATPVSLPAKVRFNTLRFAGISVVSNAPLPGTLVDVVLCVFGDKSSSPGAALAQKKAKALITAVRPYPSIPDYYDVDYSVDADFGGAFAAGSYWLSILGGSKFQLATDYHDPHLNNGPLRVKPGRWTFTGSDGAQILLQGTAASAEASAPRAPAVFSVCGAL